MQKSWGRTRPYSILRGRGAKNPGVTDSTRGGRQRTDWRLQMTTIMSKAHDKLMAGLEDARDYLSGDRGWFAVDDIDVPEPHVVAIRGRTGLSQPAVAKSIGVPLGTLKNCERGRRRPGVRLTYFSH